MPYIYLVVQVSVVVSLVCQALLYFPLLVDLSYGVTGECRSVHHDLQDILCLTEELENAWVSLFRLQLDFKVQISFRMQ